MVIQHAIAWHKMMRRLTCSLFLVFILIGACNAQSSDRLISKFEVTGGVGILKNSTYFPNSRTKLGYSFGGGVSHTFSKTLELKVRGLIERKGSETVRDVRGDDNGVPINLTRDITTDLNYITLSIMPTIHILPKKNIVFGAGAFYSWLHTAKVTVEYRDNTNPANSTKDVHTNPLNFPSKYEVGISGYVGYVLPISERHELTIMVHYNKSLMDFEDYYNTWQRNNVILVSVAFGLLR